MKARAHRSLLTLLLMAVGVLLQALLLTGHLPPVSLQRAPAFALEHGQDGSPSVRMRRPTFETGMLFPQWGQTAYSTGDANWRIGLSDMQQQTAAQWVAMPINLYQPLLK